MTAKQQSTIGAAVVWLIVVGMALYLLVVWPKGAGA